MRKKWQPYPAYKDSRMVWVGEIPESWKVRKLKHISHLRFSNVDKHTKEGELPVRLCNYVDVYYNDYIAADLDLMQATATLEEISRFTLRESNVIITKDSETWDDIAVAAYVPADLEGVLCGYHLAIVQPNTKLLDGRYLFRSFPASGINEQFKIASTGITRYGLGKYWLENSFFIVPPLHEQCAIVAFLDHETAKIDSLIAKKQRLIELLQEKRTALISHAVTKGLDSTVSFKDSSVEWIGEIPDNWKTIKMKYVSNRITKGTTPTTLGKPFVDKGIKFVKVECITEHMTVDSTICSFIDEETHKLLDRSLLRDGDVLIGIAGAIGRIAVVTSQLLPANTNQAVGIISPTRKIAIPRWIAYCLSSDSSQEFYKLATVQSAQANLSLEDVGLVSIPKPPLSDQNSIVAFLDIQAEKIDMLVTKVEVAIEKLQEYRIALISAAVTGKIDVREDATWQ